MKVYVVVECHEYEGYGDTVGVDVFASRSAADDCVKRRTDEAWADLSGGIGYVREDGRIWNRHEVDDRTWTIWERDVI